MNTSRGDDAPRLALQNLQEADQLLSAGLRRILGAAGDLPNASHPLQEALELGERQAMATLSAVEAAQVELAVLRADLGEHDARLRRLDAELQRILTTQQAQDLAGQRLQRTLALLRVVEQRIHDALGELGVAGMAGAAAAPAPCAANLDQGRVDDLLSQLGS